MLDVVIAACARALCCVLDNSTELISMATEPCYRMTGVEWHHIAPNKPQQNAFAESLIGRLRD